jgi:arylsulfatase A-like enzyme
MDHGRLDHFIAMYQESLRVPLIVSGPGIPAGRRISAPVSLIDLVPTILARVGATQDVDVEGLDLAPLWGDPDEATVSEFDERFLYGEAGGGLTLAGIAGSEFFRVYRSVRRGRYKLIAHSLSDEPEFYDLANDPNERENLAASRPAEFEELLVEYERRLQLGADEKNSENKFELDEAAADRLRELGYLIP